MPTDAMLSIRNLCVSYGAVPAVVDVDIDVPEGEIHVILGANGAGKSTIIKAILGLVNARFGAIVFCTEHKLHTMKTFAIHRLGIGWVPEGRKVWGTLSVLDNLKMGAFSVSDRSEVARHLDQMFDLFPILNEKKDLLASALSGGEQQLLAIGRCLMSKPKLMLLDEPSLGLAPMAVDHVFRTVKSINRTGISVLMAEQNARKALQVADKVYFLETGRVVDSGPVSEIASKDIVRKVFLGNDLQLSRTKTDLSARNQTGTER